MDDQSIAQLDALIPAKHRPCTYVPGTGFRMLDPWPAALRCDVVMFGGTPTVVVTGVATTCVANTTALLKWMTARDADGLRFGTHVLAPQEAHAGDAGDHAGHVAVLVRWAGPLDGLTPEGFAAVVHNVGEVAKNSCVQLVDRLGAEVPTSL